MCNERSKILQNFLMVKSHVIINEKQKTTKSKWKNENSNLHGVCRNGVHKKNYEFVRMVYISKITTCKPSHPFEELKSLKRRSKLILSLYFIYKLHNHLGIMGIAVKKMKEKKNIEKPAVLWLPPCHLYAMEFFKWNAILNVIYLALRHMLKTMFGCSLM